MKKAPRNNAVSNYLIGLLLVALMVFSKRETRENFVKNTKVYENCIQTVRRCTRGARHFVDNKVDSFGTNTKRLIRKLKL